MILNSESSSYISELDIFAAQNQVGPVNPSAACVLLI